MAQFRVGEPEPWVDVVTVALLHIVDALKAGIEPQLSARRALQATELIAATHELSRRRGRVDLPLDVADLPFLSMLEAGMVSPEEPAREDRSKPGEGLATKKEASSGAQ
jgi:UDP-N-acetylglucosamine 3-dehydrogenase